MQNTNYDVKDSAGNVLFNAVNAACFSSLPSALKTHAEKARYVVYYPLCRPDFPADLRAKYEERAKINFKLLQHSVIGKFLPDSWEVAKDGGVCFDITETPVIAIVNACSAMRLAMEFPDYNTTMKVFAELAPGSSANARLFLSEVLTLTTAGWERRWNDGHRMCSSKVASITGFKNFINPAYWNNSLYELKNISNKLSYSGRSTVYDDTGSETVLRNEFIAAKPPSKLRSVFDRHKAKNVQPSVTDSDVAIYLNRLTEIENAER